jgi:hypothetical protein
MKKCPPGKENKAPGNLTAGRNAPEWLQSTLKLVTQRELGTDWQKCVEKWLELERKLAYGDGVGKVSF